MMGTKIGLIRGTPGSSTTPVFNFDSDGNGVGPAPADSSDRVDNFLPPAGFSGSQSGDIAVIGDWNGDGHSKAGWFRPSTGEWFLDYNNAGVFTNGVSLHYTGFGQPGDVPVVGDWAGLGRSCVGVYRAGFLWVLDLNCDGTFQPPGGNPVTGDAVFAFGSAGNATVPADVPVVGNWFGFVNPSTGKPISQAGTVRPFVNAADTLALSGPALWLLDIATPGTVSGTTGSPTAQSNHGLGNAPGVAFGGSLGDVPIVGDWSNTGLTQFGDWAQGFLFVLDNAPATAPQSGHGLLDIVFAYGGLTIDKPIAGKW